MKPKWTTLIAGLSLLIPWMVLAPFPSISNGSVIPAWYWFFWFFLMFFGYIGEWAPAILTMMIPALFFFAWNPGLFRGSVNFPRRTYALFAVVAVLSLGYFSLAWSDGLRNQGVRYTYTVFAANIVLVAILGFLFTISRKEQPSFRTNMFLHWTLFVWLFWFAFPFFGQLSFP